MRLLLPLLALLATSIPALAQFTIRIQQTDNVTLVANGGGIVVNTPLGGSENLTVVVTYQGQGVATVLSAPELLGSTAFAITAADATPQALFPGVSYRYSVRFTPRNSRAVSSQVSFRFSESITGSGQNPVTTTTFGTVLVQFGGTAPEFVVSYVPADTLSNVPLANGGTIPFPLTQINSSNTVTLSIANRGSGAGEVRSLNVAGAAFLPVGTPLLPISIPAGSELRSSLRFQPLTEGPQTGQLSVTTVNETLSFTLSGTAYQTRFGYQLINKGNLSDLTSGQTINLGEALPNETLSAQVLITNTNAVAVTVPAISLFGAGYTLTDLPAATRTLRPGETVGFFVQALIAQIGAQRGRLRIGDDTFDLLATGSGAQLRYSYTSGGSGSIVLSPASTLFFTSTPIGSTRSAVFTIQNSGISEANLINISIAEVSSAFTLTSLPALPARLQPGQQLSFGIDFRPTGTVSNNATLRVDGATFALSGSSTQAPPPQPLPPYRFTLSSGNVNPLDQPSTGLELTAPFPTALSGVLTLSQETNSFANDPSVRFVNGATTVAFTIPANTTRAIFPNGSNTIRFQTGSVAGVIILAATFTQSGTTTAVEDPNPAFLRLTMLPAAPRILSAGVTVGTSVINLDLTGLVTTRSITKMDIQITPAPGFNFPVTNFSLNLEGYSLAWFRSAASQGFGGIFSLQVPLVLSFSGNTSTSTGSNVSESISRIQIVLTNEAGSSSPFTLTLR